MIATGRGAVFVKLAMQELSSNVSVGNCEVSSIDDSELSNNQNPPSSAQQSNFEVTQSPPGTNTKLCKESPNTENNLSNDKETSSSSGSLGTSRPKQSDVCYAALYDTSNSTVLRLIKVTNEQPVISSEGSDEDDTDADPNFSQDLMYESESSSSQIDGRLENVGDEAGKKGKKRVQNPEKWFNKKAKLNRNSEKQYISASKTKKQLAKEKQCHLVEKNADYAVVLKLITQLGSKFFLPTGISVIYKGKENILLLMQNQSYPDIDILVHKT